MSEGSVPFDHPWPEGLIREIGSVTVGGTPRTSIPDFWGGNIQWMASGDVHLKRIMGVPGRITERGLRSSNATLVSPPSVAVGLAGQGKTRGTVALVEAELCTNQSVALLKCDPDHLDIEYLFHNLWFRYEELRSRSAGGGRAGLSKGILEQISIPLPKLTEQRVIAEVLSTLDRAIEQTEALIAKQQRIKTGLMQDLLTKGIDEHGNIRSEATHAFKDSPLGRIPVEWDVVSVRDAGEVTLGRQLSPKYMTGKNPVPYLRVANVFDGWIDYTDVLEMDFSETERRKYFLRPGDILLNEGQSIELVGRSSIFFGPTDSYCFQNTLIRFRLFENVDPNYSQSVFKWWLDRGEFQDVARQTTSVAHLGADRFASMLFPRPHIKEQLRVSKILEEHEAFHLANGNRLSKLIAMKRGLMHDLLTGQRRVTPLLSQATTQ